MARKPSILRSLYYELHWDEFEDCIYGMCRYLEQRNLARDVPIYGIPRGGLPLAVALSHYTGRRMLDHVGSYRMLTNVIVVDDICDTGKTLEQIYTLAAPACVLTWVKKPVYNLAGGAPAPHVDYAQILWGGDKWVKFPWEAYNNLAAEAAAHRARSSK